MDLRGRARRAACRGLQRPGKVGKVSSLSLPVGETSPEPVAGAARRVVADLTAPQRAVEAA